MVRVLQSASVRPAFVLLVALAAAGCGVGITQQYEYEEEIYLSVDGSATIYVNASIPSLVNLRGLDLDATPSARLDKNTFRALYTSPATRVSRVSTWRRFGRRFVQIRVEVDDIRKLGTAPPFSWGTIQLEKKDDLLVFREMLAAAAGKAVGDVGWTGREQVAFRVHLPSKIRYHNAAQGNLRRGNILVWEQTFAERQAGKPLEMEARIETVSILYRTLWLFGVSGLLAIAVLAAIIWWVMRKPAAAAGATGG
jgi:hypothetical protein